MENLTVSATIDSFMQAADQAGARAAIGASSQSLATTATGLSFLALTNPGAVTFVRVNADNSVTPLSASAFRTAIGAGTSSFDASAPALTGPLALSSVSPAGQITVGFAAASVGSDELLFSGPGGNIIALQSTSASHFSAMVFRASDGVERGAIGYANATLGAPFQGGLYIEASYYTGVANANPPAPFRLMQTGSFDGTEGGYGTKLRHQITSTGFIHWYNYDGTEAVSIDSVNSRVGIHKAAPTAALDIVGATSLAGNLTQTSGDTYLIGGRTRIGYNAGAGIESSNFGTLQLLTTQGAAACFSITENDVATGHFGFAANSGTFVLGADGPAISFRANPSGTLAAGTERMSLDLSTGDLEIKTAGQGLILKSPDGTRHRITVANGGTVTSTAL